ncbi:MAG: GIY-YIG nuclease family protein [Armatimonadetes bacterium]|nr:GIY-YIG nuclease family protein [Armatimonadota bacterium]
MNEVNRDCTAHHFLLVYFMYILQSESSGRFYVGHTDDLDQHLEFHNTGQSHYTARRGPWKLVYSEPFETCSEAMNRETEIKRWKSATLIRKLIADSEV